MGKSKANDFSSNEISQTNKPLQLKNSKLILWMVDAVYLIAVKEQVKQSNLQA
jgi:phage antirepressor YoqD-like protein